MFKRHDKPRSAYFFAVLYVAWVVLWVYFDSRDSGVTSTTIHEVGKPDRIEVTYDFSNRYKPTLPEIVGWFVGGAVAVVVTLWLRSHSVGEDRLLSLVVSALVSCTVCVAYVWSYHFFVRDALYPRDMGIFSRFVSASGISLFYAPGIVVFAGTPAALASAAMMHCLASRSTAHRAGLPGYEREHSRHNPRLYL